MKVMNFQKNERPIKSYKIKLYTQKHVENNLNYDQANIE